MRVQIMSQWNNIMHACMIFSGTNLSQFLRPPAVHSQMLWFVSIHVVSKVVFQNMNMHTNDDTTSFELNDIRIVSEQEENGSTCENSTTVPIAQAIQITRISQSLQKEVASLKEEIFSQKQIIAKNTEPICKLQQLFEKQTIDEQNYQRLYEWKREDGNVDFLEVTWS